MKQELSYFRPVGIVTFGLVMAVISAASFAADAEALQACQSIEDDDARLACFDAALAQKPVPAAEPPPAVPPAPSAKPAAQPGTLSDEIGRETVEDIEKEELSVRGRVTKCVEGRSGRYVFYFDNGQVWRQRGSANVRWKECAFDVTISEDPFGYVMYRDGEKRKVRIERVK